MNRLISSDSEYQTALVRLKELIVIDPEPDSELANELNLLSLIVEDYEAKQFTFSPPTPIEAIKFRMDQLNLIQRDLVPYIGSRSKVSEVLSGSRPLSLPMIRSLSHNLYIPANVLLQEYQTADAGESQVDWEKFPVREMKKRKWITSLDTTHSGLGSALQRFLSVLPEQQLTSVLFRKTSHVRSNRLMDKYALTAWTARIANKAEQEELENKYDPSNLNKDVLTELVRLSAKDKGPLYAKKFLSKLGVALIIEPHLPRTHLDGAALLFNQPIIGLTLRHDRIDNFWFTLIHEITHIFLHLGRQTDSFFDDLDLRTAEDPREKEADALTREIIIPRSVWDSNAASQLPTADAAFSLADKLRIHPALVAGKIRFEYNNFRILGNLVGNNEVQRLFPGAFKWKE